MNLNPGAINTNPETVRIRVNGPITGSTTVELRQGEYPTPAAKLHVLTLIKAVLKGLQNAPTGKESAHFQACLLKSIGALGIAIDAIKCAIQLTESEPLNFEYSEETIDDLNAFLLQEAKHLWVLTDGKGIPQYASNAINDAYASMYDYFSHQIQTESN